MSDRTTSRSWLRQSLGHQGGHLPVQLQQAAITGESAAIDGGPFSIDEYFAAMASSLSDEELQFHNARLPEYKRWSRFHASIAREVQKRRCYLDEPMDLAPYLTGRPNDRPHGSS